MSAFVFGGNVSIKEAKNDGEPVPKSGPWGEKTHIESKIFGIFFLIIKVI